MSWISNSYQIYSGLKVIEFELKISQKKLECRKYYAQRSDEWIRFKIKALIGRASTFANQLLGWCKYGVIMEWEKLISCKFDTSIKNIFVRMWDYITYIFEGSMEIGSMRLCKNNKIQIYVNYRYGLIIQRNISPHYHPQRLCS